MEVKIDESNLSIARVYAQALLGLAADTGQADGVREELAELGRLLDQNADFERFVSNLLIDEKETRVVLERLLRNKSNDLLVNTLQTMNRKGRLGFLRELIVAYGEEQESSCGRIEVKATTAVPLRDDQRRRLTEAVSKFTGKEARLTESVDDSLIGGMVLRIGDSKIDSSVAKEIRRVGARLLERASAEIHAGKLYLSEAEGD